MKNSIDEWFEMLGRNNEERLKVVKEVYEYSLVDQMSRIDVLVCEAILRRFHIPFPIVKRAERGQ